MVNLAAVRVFLNRCPTEKAAGRFQARRPVNSVPKPEATDESFEDLLLKYKQIQLELECIRKEERMALKEDEEPPAPATTEEPISAAREEEKKAFQAFNLKPLRQKLLTPAERDALNTRPAQTPDGDGAERDGGPDDGIGGPVHFTALDCTADCHIEASFLVFPLSWEGGGV